MRYMPAMARERLLPGEASRVHISLDGREITPDTAKLIGGFVGHSGLATTGGDGGQADELVIDLSDEETKQ